MDRRKGKLLNKKYGYLTTIVYLGDRKYLCKCKCGNKKIVISGNLATGHIKSSGCLRSIHRKNYQSDMKAKLIGKIKKINGCWEWQGSRNKKGYGHLSYKRKVELAHRISWLMFKGKIPNDMKVCHKCDNPPCINPSHLFLGSQKENVKDMFQKKRKIHEGINHPGAKLTNENIKEIRKLLREGKTQQYIADKYNISNGHVGSIKHRRTWKEI